MAKSTCTTRHDGGIEADFLEMVLKLGHAFAGFGSQHDGTVFEGFLVEAGFVFVESDFNTDCICFSRISVSSWSICQKRLELCVDLVRATTILVGIVETPLFETFFLCF
jgi:hypothetical protein